MKPKFRKRKNRDVNEPTITINVPQGIRHQGSFDVNSERCREALDELKALYGGECFAGVSRGAFLVFLVLC